MYCQKHCSTYSAAVVPRKRFLIAAFTRTRKHTSGLKILWLQDIIVTATLLHLPQRLTVNSYRKGSPPQKKMAEKEGGVTFSQDIPEEETEPGKFCFHQRSWIFWLRRDRERHKECDHSEQRDRPNSLRGDGGDRDGSEGEHAGHRPGDRGERRHDQLCGNHCWGQPWSGGWRCVKWSLLFSRPNRCCLRKSCLTRERRRCTLTPLGTFLFQVVATI